MQNPAETLGIRVRPDNPNYPEIVPETAPMYVAAEQRRKVCNPRKDDMDACSFMTDDSRTPNGCFLMREKMANRAGQGPCKGKCRTPFPRGACYGCSSAKYECNAGADGDEYGSYPNPAPSPVMMRARNAARRTRTAPAAATKKPAQKQNLWESLRGVFGTVIPAGKPKTAATPTPTANTKRAAIARKQYATQQRGKQAVAPENYEGPATPACRMPVPHPYPITGGYDIQALPANLPYTVTAGVDQCYRSGRAQGANMLADPKDRICSEDVPRVYNESNCVAMAPMMGPNVTMRDTTYAKTIAANRNWTSIFAFPDFREDFPPGAGQAYEKQLAQSENGFEDGYFEVINTSHDDQPVRGDFGYYDTCCGAEEPY